MINQEIPKVIHYCWFGRSKKPKEALRCIKSWKKYLPGYQFVEWNEENFDINANLYVKQAYDARKFAFVTDYVRLYVLYHRGGIYMDTDVEVLKNLDEFLDKPAFSGFERHNLIPTGIMGSVEGHPWIGRLLEYYTDLSFLKGDGTTDTTTNTKVITEITNNEYGLKFGNEMQVLRDDVYIYPSEYFCPKDNITGEIHTTNHSYTIHHFAGSWLPDKLRYRIKLTWWLRNAVKSCFGESNYNKVTKMIKQYL